MFINIGSDAAVFYKDIIAIINIKSASGEINKEYIENAEKNNCCTILGKNSRSVIITEKKGGEKIFLSPVSAKTIKKRFRNYL